MKDLKSIFDLLDSPETKRINDLVSSPETKRINDATKIIMGDFAQMDSNAQMLVGNNEHAADFPLRIEQSNRREDYKRRMAELEAEADFKARQQPTPVAVDKAATAGAALAPVAVAAKPTFNETAEQRQQRRYGACIAAGLTINIENTFATLPRGIGALARAEGISTAAFSKDVKLHIERLANG